MEFQISANLHLHRWNRKLVTVYWLIAATSCLLEIVYAPLATEPFSVYAHKYILIPTAGLAVGLTAVELALLAIPNKLQDYVVILGALYIATLLISVHAEVSAIMITLVFPFMISVYYFQKKKVYFAATVAMAIYLMLYALHPGVRESQGIPGLLSVVFSLLFGTRISIGIVNRGQEIIQQLTATMESRQELLVKTILMDKISKTDALTDLYNHITFHEFLDKIIEQIEHNHADIPLQVAVIDIDNFKEINDTFGHRAGDKVLQRVAGLIKEQTDPNDFVARYGGEEFAIIFTEKTLDDCYRIVENIRENIARIPNEELNGKPVTLSSGLQEYHRGDGKERLFAGADASLYEAKKTGKNKTVVSGKPFTTAASGNRSI